MTAGPRERRRNTGKVSWAVDVLAALAFVVTALLLYSLVSAVAGRGAVRHHGHLVSSAAWLIACASTASAAFTLGLRSALRLPTGPRGLAAMVSVAAPLAALLAWSMGWDTNRGIAGRMPSAFAMVFSLTAGLPVVAMVLDYEARWFRPQPPAGRPRPWLNRTVVGLLIAYLGLGAFYLEPKHVIDSDFGIPGVSLPPLSFYVAFLVAKTACVRRRWQLLVWVTLSLLLFIAGLILLIVVGMSIAVLGARHG